VTIVEVEGHTPAKAGAKLLVRRDGSSVGTVGGGALEKLCIERATGLLDGGASEVQRYLLDESPAPEGAAPGRHETEDRPGGETVEAPMACGGTVTVFFDSVASSAEVCLVGAGHIGRALAYLLGSLDVRLRIFDDRPEMLDEIPDKPRLSKLPLTIPPPDGLLPSNAFIVVATHSHDLDYEVVKALLSRSKPPRYLGLVASRRKLKLFLSRLEKDLGAGFDRAGLFAPCGLNIASRDPNEIALAIAAEILAVKNGASDIIHLSRAQDTI